MPGSTSGQTTISDFLRSASLLIACIFVVALLLAPFALKSTGSAGPAGLAVAAAVCLFAGIGAEAISTVIARLGSPLAGAMLGMGIRMLPPLILCLGLAVSGQSGREHLAFVFYLLAFYFATLVMETVLAVKRVTAIQLALRNNPR